MSEREEILARIRAGLATTAARPGGGCASGAGSLEDALPKAGRTFEERLEQFRSHAAELRAGFELLDSPSAMQSRIARLSVEEGWKRIASHRGEWAEAASAAAVVPVLMVDGGYGKAELEACDAGITECDALIAQTGSVLVTSRSAGGRALSVLPPHHVVIARREQLLADLAAAFELLKKKYAPNYPSSIALITGPSRTGDIERILVLGAHGPKKLTILCV